jgi:hypothetical protein
MYAVQCRIFCRLKVKDITMKHMMMGKEIAREAIAASTS